MTSRCGLIFFLRMKGCWIYFYAQRSIVIIFGVINQIFQTHPPPVLNKHSLITVFVHV